MNILFLTTCATFIGGFFIAFLSWFNFLLCFIVGFSIGKFFLSIDYSLWHAMFRKLSLTGIFFDFISFKSSLPSSMRSASDIFLTSLNRFFIVKPAYCIHAALMLDGQYYSVANYCLNRNYKYFIILIGGKFCPQLKICSFA